MEKINVSLYGGIGIFGGKEEPLRSETIYCDSYENCSLYKEGKCLKCAALSAFTANCPVGKVEHQKGYTSRAKKYWDFKEKATGDESYNKLNYPSNCDFAVLGGNILFFHLCYVSVYKPNERQLKENPYLLTNGYSVDDRSLNNAFSYVAKEDVTMELLRRIFTYKPRAMFGGVIDDYQEKVVPNVLKSMQKLVPDIYNEFVKTYPEFADRLPDYRGRYAYISSLRDGLEFSDNGTKGVKHGNKIIVEDFRSSFLPFGKKARCEIEISEKDVIKILDNNWVDDNTRFR